MMSEPSSYPEDPPDPGELVTSLSAPDAERDLVGAVLYDELAFEQAGLKSGDFYIQRWRWVWEACEKIKASGDHIDQGTLEKELEKAERLLVKVQAIDRPDVEKQMTTVRTALTDRKWEQLTAASNELADTLFYLEDA